METEPIYIIIDTRTNQQVVVSSGKFAWRKSNHAKTAIMNFIGSLKVDNIRRFFNDAELSPEFVNENSKGYSDYINMKFDDQKRYICYLCEFSPLETV